MSCLSRPVVSTPLVLCLLLQSCPGRVHGEEIDLDTLIAAARPVLEADLATWAKFRFHRRVLRERLSRQGDVVRGHEYFFEVRPDGGGFDERLLEIDGRQPTRREVEDHRRAGRFHKHYLAAVDAELRNPFGVDLPLLPLLFDQEHHHVGQETASGIPCHRIAFEARQEPNGASAPERLKYATKGTLCLSVVGTHVVEAEAESVRRVASWPLRLNRLSLRFESRPQEGTWLPRLFLTRSDAKIGFHRQQKRNRYEYTDYHRP